MKVIVVERFVDKYTKEFYKKDQKIEVTKARYEENKKYVKPVEKQNKKNEENGEG